MPALVEVAAAQPPAKPQPTSVSFFESRVLVGLVTDGVALLRHDLGPQIAQIGGKWLMSLVDLATCRMTAWTRSTNRWLLDRNEPFVAICRDDSRGRSLAQCVGCSCQLSIKWHPPTLDDGPYHSTRVPRV